MLKIIALLRAFYHLSFPVSKVRIVQSFKRQVLGASSGQQEPCVVDKSFKKLSVPVAYTSPTL